MENIKALVTMFLLKVKHVRFIPVELRVKERMN